MNNRKPFTDIFRVLEQKYECRLGLSVCVQVLNCPLPDYDLFFVNRKLEYTMVLGINSSQLLNLDRRWQHNILPIYRNTMDS